MEGHAEPERNDPSVHEWLDRVSAAGAQGSTGGDDPVVATICAAAVDPLEIAAALEAAGMSHQVVNDVYGRPDVFTLAGQLWVQVPFQAPVVQPAAVERRGGLPDLARGALYAAPAFSLFALTRSLHVRLAWWTLPLALTWGWALGQVTAFTGYTLRGRGNAAGEARIGGLLLVFAALSTTALAAGAVFVTRGGVGSVVAAAGVTTYMVASAILLLHNEEWIAAQLLAPGATASAVALIPASSSDTDLPLIVVIVGSAAITVVGATRHLRFTARGDFGLGTTDLRISLAHLAHGVLCGLALSLVAIHGAHTHAENGSPAILALPLLLTLGIMEWQLRSFKAGIGHLTRRHTAFDQFRPKARVVFLRSFGIYVVAGVIASAAVAVAIWIGDDTPPYGVLGSQVVLGAAFFLDLTIVSIGRLDLVLPCWLIGVAAGLTYAAWVELTDSVAGDVLIWRSACVAAVVAFISLFLRARRVAPAAISH